MQRRTTASQHPVPRGARLKCALKLEGAPWTPLPFRDEKRVYERADGFYGVDVTRNEFNALEAAYLWAEPYGAAALVPPDSGGLAYGAVEVGPGEQSEEAREGRSAETGERMRRVRHEWLRPPGKGVMLCGGAARFTAEQMAANAESEVVQELRKANERADRIYEEELKQAAEAMGYSKIELATAEHDHGWFAFMRNEVESRVDSERAYQRDAVTLRFDEKEEGLGARYLEYHQIKDDAFYEWGKLVRPEPYLTGDEGAKGLINYANSELSSAGYGDEEWDFKPVIGRVWGHRNRIGNSPHVYFYDIWANLHYGYVGRAAGFSTKLLKWASNAQQKSGTGKVGGEDTQRDTQAVESGALLWNREGTAEASTLLTQIAQGILRAYQPGDYNIDTGWGHLDYGIGPGVQTEEGETIELRRNQ